jgi:hypothetical protein
MLYAFVCVVGFFVSAAACLIVQAEVSPDAPYESGIPLLLAVGVAGGVVAVLMLRRYRTRQRR